MTLLEFTIDTTTPLLNEWQRMHWVTRSRTTTDFAWHIRSKVGRWNKPPIQSCVIYIERHSSMLPDWDGLYGGLKPLLDALVKNTPRNPKGLGIIEDDSPLYIKQLIAIPLKCKRKEKRTVVRIMDGDTWNIQEISA